MRQLKINIETKLSERIEKAAARLEIKPEQLCLYSICEKMEEISDYKSPLMLVDLEALKVKIDGMDFHFNFLRDKFRDYYFKITELDALRKKEEISVEKFEEKIISAGDEIKNLLMLQD